MYADEKMNTASLGQSGPVSPAPPSAMEHVHGILASAIDRIHNVSNHLAETNARALGEEPEKGGPATVQNAPMHFSGAAGEVERAGQMIHDLLDHLEATAAKLSRIA